MEYISKEDALCAINSFAPNDWMDVKKAEDAINSISSPWVKAVDRMPEVGQKVLVYWKRTVFTSTPNEYTSEYITTAKYAKCDDPEENVFGQLCWVSAWDGEVIYAPISHWMPMPDVPNWEE